MTTDDRDDAESKPTWNGFGTPPRDYVPEGRWPPPPRPFRGIPIVHREGRPRPHRRAQGEPRDGAAAPPETSGEPS